jgi:hypothetical protein
VHEEFHHGVEADGFAFFSRHEDPPVLSCEVLGGASNLAQANG